MIKRPGLWALLFIALFLSTSCSNKSRRYPKAPKRPKVKKKDCNCPQWSHHPNAYEVEHTSLCES